MKLNLERSKFDLKLSNLAKNVTAMVYCKFKGEKKFDYERKKERKERFSANPFVSVKRQSFKPLYEPSPLLSYTKMSWNHTLSFLKT